MLIRVGLASICSPALGSELAKSPLEEIAASASVAGKGQSLTNIKALAFRIGVKSVVSTLGHGLTLETISYHDSIVKIINCAPSGGGK